MRVRPEELIAMNKKSPIYDIMITPIVKIPPKIAVSSFMGYLKGKSSLMIFENHANLKYNYGNRNFWAEGYYVTTVGLNKKTVENYIWNQELEDQLKDKRSLKEYKDPFTGK